MIIANLLQKEDSKLVNLGLENTGMGDEEAEIIATSLKHNTKLQYLYLMYNDNLGVRGCCAFLKLLNDISSIESTYNSNYSLKEVDLSDGVDENPVLGEIEVACRQNRGTSKAYECTNPEAAGRAKFIYGQLSNANRKRLCQIQGIGYSSIGNLLVDVEQNLLPDVLALIGREHGQSDFYTALIPLAPELLSFIDRRAMIKQDMAKNTTEVSDLAHQVALLTERMSILNAKNDLLSKRLEIIDSGDSRQSVVAWREEIAQQLACDKKKRRRE